MEEGTALTDIRLYHCLCDCTESAFHYLATIINLQLSWQPSGPVTLPSLLFPHFFSVSYALFHSVLSLAFFPSLIFYLLCIPFLLHTEGTVLCTLPQANFDYFQGEVLYLCAVFISSYVACL